MLGDVKQLKVIIDGDEQPRIIKGRFAWTLAQLIDAGWRGVTPLERPAPRWSHYVHILRKDEGLTIETIEEGHQGPFKGKHGRYVLRSPIRVIEAVPAYA